MIGVFDSGFGGLTILRALLEHPRLAHHSYLYLGDSNHAPYGDKTHEEIFIRTVRGVTFLFEQGCTLVIIACNSASAKALRRVQQEWLPKHYPNRRILGVIRPIAEAMALTSPYRRIGILATAATVHSSAYPVEIERAQPGAIVIQQAAPALVLLIESGNGHGQAITDALQTYLQPLLAQSIDVLVPACTHYPLIQAQIQKLLPHNCALLDAATIIATSLADYLDRHPELDIHVVTQPTTHYYTTGNMAHFKELGERFLQREIGRVTKVMI